MRILFDLGYVDSMPESMTNSTLTDGSYTLVSDFLHSRVVA